MEDIFCLQKLPEISEKVFIFLDTSSVLECRSVCRAFNLVIENPHFWLKKLAFDGQPKSFHKMMRSVIFINRKMNGLGSFNNKKYFFKFVRSNLIENQFYGLWGHSFFKSIVNTSGFKSKSPEDCIYKSVTVLHGALANFLSKWKQVIKNQSQVNYTFDKNIILYLIKVNKIIEAFKRSDEEKEAVAQCISTVSKEMYYYMNLNSIRKKERKEKWIAQANFSRKLQSTVSFYQSWNSYFELLLKYMPTLTCTHCTLARNGSKAPKPKSKTQCSECNKYRNVNDLPLDVEDPSKFGDLNHILELCFNHRKKVVKYFGESLIYKFLIEKAQGAAIFVDVEEYGFHFSSF